VLRLQRDRVSTGFAPVTVELNDTWLVDLGNHEFFEIKLRAGAYKLTVVSNPPAKGVEGAFGFRAVARSDLRLQLEPSSTSHFTVRPDGSWQWRAEPATSPD
jgi:hypothetical protein